MMKRPGILSRILEFWTPRPEIKKVWFSLFTPQAGDQMPEILSFEERARVIARDDAIAKAISEAGHAGSSIRHWRRRQPASWGAVCFALH
jgi:hypothetical protein